MSHAPVTPNLKYPFLSTSLPASDWLTDNFKLEPAGSIEKHLRKRSDEKLWFKLVRANHRTTRGVAVSIKK